MATFTTDLPLDPLALLAYQSSLVNRPLREGAAEGATALDTQQRAAIIGEVIPIVFCRRIGTAGGALISPPATEARFENAPNGDVTASYHLVLSEGQISSVQVRDVFQRSCRVGTFTQTYNRRAGTFAPGNFITVANLEAPYYCGTGGSYEGLSTMAFSVTIPAGFDQWNRQVHAFIRGGLHVTRLLDGVAGPSNNVCDLLLYLLSKSSKVNTAQIDTTALLAAARFTDTNGFWFNGLVDDSSNIRDWMTKHLQYFLLRESRSGGKESVRPLLPTNSDGTLDTSPVSWSFTFTEEHISPEQFQIRYTPLADRKPFCALMLWRQQPEDDLGIIRSTEVRYSGSALAGPFEQHDLSKFCTTENHAVKLGAFILSRRRHISHTLAIQVRPDSFNETLSPGDLVRVRLNRIASTGAASVHDYLYEVDRIGKSLTGEVLLELTHFPVDEQLRSVVAQEVAAAQGSGILLPTGKTGVSCDVNSSADTSVPADTGSDYVPAYAGAFDYEMAAIDADGSLDGEKSDNAKSASSTNGPAIGGYGNIVPAEGDELTYTPTCAGAYIEWYLVDDATGGRTKVSEGVAAKYIVSSAATAAGVSVLAIGRCPDPSSPTGYGPEITSSPIKAGGSIVYGFGLGTYTLTLDLRTYISARYRCSDGSLIAAENNPVYVYTPGTVSYTYTYSGVYGLQWDYKGMKTYEWVCGPPASYTTVDFFVQRTKNASGVWTRQQNSSTDQSGEGKEYSYILAGLYGRWYIDRSIENIKVYFNGTQVSPFGTP